MMKRKVTFWLEKLDSFGFDPEQTEEETKQIEKLTKVRQGVFHCWTEIEEKSNKSDNFIIKTVALIEDLETGKILNVDFDHFQFTEKPDKK